MSTKKSDQASSVRATRLRYAGAILWASFLAASIGSMVFFAMFDPLRLGEITTWPVELDRKWGYTLGFFGLWALALLSSFITAILLSPGNQSNKTGDE